MMDRSPKPPEALMRAIAQDLRPVGPSPQPLQLALRMVPLALLVSSVILLAIGPRHDLGILGPLLGWGARRAVRVSDRARLDRRARKHTRRQAAEADGLPRGRRCLFGRCICHHTHLLDKPCDRAPPARPATRQRNAARLAMDHGLRLRDRQHASRGNPGPVLQLGVSKLARDPANCSGRPVWRRRGSRDQCRLAHCMPVFDPVACAGSARSSDHRYGALRSTHRALFRKSQIAHRRQTFLSTWVSLNVDAETLDRRDFPVKRLRANRKPVDQDATGPYPRPSAASICGSARTLSRSGHSGSTLAPAAISRATTSRWRP